MIFKFILSISHVDVCLFTVPNWSEEALFIALWITYVLRINNLDPFRDETFLSFGFNMGYRTLYLPTLITQSSIGDVLQMQPFNLSLSSKIKL